MLVINTSPSQLLKQLTPEAAISKLGTFMFDNGIFLLREQFELILSSISNVYDAAEMFGNIDPPVVPFHL